MQRESKQSLTQVPPAEKLVKEHPVGSEDAWVVQGTWRRMPAGPEFLRATDGIRITMPPSWKPATDLLRVVHEKEGALMSAAFLQQTTRATSGRTSCNTTGLG
jgi:hypothetical protein